MALLALVNHVVKFDFQALLSLDRLQARITSTKSRRFIQVAANDSFESSPNRPVTADSGIVSVIAIFHQSIPHMRAISRYGQVTSIHPLTFLHYAGIGWAIPVQHNIYIGPTG